MKTTRGSTVECRCARCGDTFTARVADRKRGWARFCSKSCKAKTQEARTGQFAAYMNRAEGHDEPTFDQAHLFSNEDYFSGKD
jgi:hypothetical protein